MANDEVLGPRKTVFVLVIVMGCFAVLWPRMLSPAILGPSKEQMQPNQFDREAGCCEVIFETDVAVLELVNEVCNSALGVGKLSPHSAAECRKAVNETCGLDIAAFLKRNENVGRTTKTLVEIMQNSNSSCLRENFGVPVYSLGPHLAVKSWSQPDTLKQERVAIRGMGPHPALRERGRAIPPGPPGPPPPARSITMPPHVRVRSPLSVYYEDVQPPPIPGMRPPLGSPGVVPSPKSSMGFVMPIYTICIIVFFVYTLSKLLFKRATSPYDPVDPDPHFRRRVFRDDSRTSPDKLVVTAISGLVAEVQQQMEASYAQNQQRQDVQDSTRPFTNGTILLNSGPVHIVASEYQEGSKASESNDKEASEPKDATPESRKVVIESTPECDTVPEHTEPVLDHKNSDQEVRESSSEPTFTTDHESSSEEKNTPVHTVDKDTLERNELTSQLKEALVSSQVDADFTPDSKDSILESDDLAPKLEESPLALDQPISPESTPSVLDNQVHTIELKESDSETEDLIEQSPEVNEPTPDTVTEPKQSSSKPEPKESSPKPVSQSGESSPEPDPAISKHKEPSADSEPVISEPKELSPEPVIPESKELSPEPAICEPEDSPPEPVVPDPKQPSPSPEPIICVPKELSPEPCIPDPKDSSPEPEPIVTGAHEPDETIPIDSIPVEHTEHKESELEKSIPVEESNLDLKEPTPQPKEPTPATEDPKPEDTAKVTKNKQSLNLDDTTEERKETPEQKESANDEPEVKDTLVEVQKQKEPATNDIDDVKDKERDDLILTDFTDVGKDDSLTKAAEEFLKVERECEKQSTAELLEEALKEGSPKEEEIENAAVKVMGMEVTAHPADGGAWPRELPPAPSPPPARVPHEAPEVKAIYLETEIPQQSRVLVAQFAEDRQADRDSPAKHSPLVVSGKMTLSLIQDAPRDTPERDLESTLDEFTTASAVTQPAAEKEDTDSEEEIEIEFEEEIEEEEEEIEEELPVKPKGGK